MNYSYNPKDVCSKKIDIDIENDIVKKIKFTGGCNGNTQGIAKLCVGRNVNDIINLLKGIRCNGRPTSCPDQLARALEEYKIQ